MSRAFLVGVTAADRRRLTRLKIRHESGSWPIPLVTSERSINYPVMLHTVSRSGDDRFRHDCQIQSELSSFRSPMYGFRTNPTCSEAPAADEVIRWLGLVAMCQCDGYDQIHTDLLYHMTVIASHESAPYRGLTFDPMTESEFLETSSLVEDQLRQLLQPYGFTA